MTSAEWTEDRGRYGIDAEGGGGGGIRNLNEQHELQATVCLLFACGHSCNVAFLWSFAQFVSDCSLISRLKGGVCDSNAGEGGEGGVGVGDGDNLVN